MLAGEREHKAGNSKLLFQLGVMFSQDTVLPRHLGPFLQHWLLVQGGVPRGLGMIKPGLKAGEGLGWDLTRASYLWCCGSSQKWKAHAAATLALMPCPLLSLPPSYAESEPDSALHLNLLGVHVIHLVCGATPVLLFSIDSLLKAEINVSLGSPFVFIFIS